MIRWVWVDGRFTWPVIVTVVFLSISLVGFDLVWRLVKIQLRGLLLYAMLADAAAALAVAAICVFLRRRWQSGRE